MKKFISFLISTFLIASTIGNSFACTALVVTDINGNAYKGRTVELSALLPSTLTYLPVGTRVDSLTPDGKPGNTFNTKYLALGLAYPYPGSNLPAFVDASNDQGLTISLNSLNNSSGPPVGKDASKIISANNIPIWVVGNFKNVAEVKAALLSGANDFWLPSTPVLGNLPYPIHYGIWDKTGAGIVLEFMNGKMHVYDNPVNVMTNGPAFPWHLENLNNYTFTNQDKNTGQLGKLKLQTQDAGIALTSLPGAETATGRFVKAAFYANYVRKGKTPDEAIITLGHIMNNFDRPFDLTVDAAGAKGDGGSLKGMSSEVTLMTTMIDLSRNLAYFRSIDTLNWAVVDINKLKNVNQIKNISIYDLNRNNVDAFNAFYK